MKTVSRTSAIVLAISALSACGGGGGDGGPSAKPSALPVSGRFATVETRQVTDTSASSQLVVVNIQTGEQARVYDLGSPLKDYPSKNWAVAFQVKPDADGLGFVQDGEGQLAFIQDGKVMLLDLTGTSLGTARQLTSSTDACTINRNPAAITHATFDTKHVWFRVQTAGPDQSCTSTDDNQSVLISSDMLPGDTPIASGKSSNLDLIDSLNDGASITTAGMLVLNRTSGVLSVFTNDLKTKLYDVAVPDHILQANEAARALLNSPLNGRQALVQLGASLYVADWSSGKFKLNTPVARLTSSTTSDTEAPVVAKDSDMFYVADGNKGLAIRAEGVLKAVIDFPAVSGDIKDVMVLDSTVVVNQTTASTVTTGSNAVSTLWSLKKADGTFKHLASSGGPGAVLQLETSAGDTVVFSQPSGTDTRWRRLYAAPAEGVPIPIKEGQGVGIIDHVSNPHRRAGLRAIDGLIWCEPKSYTLGCADSKLVRYTTTAEGGVQTPLGTLNAAGGAVLSRLFGVHETWAGRTAVLNLVRETSPTSLSFEPWLINPDLADSMKPTLAQP